MNAAEEDAGGQAGHPQQARHPAARGVAVKAFHGNPTLGLRPWLPGSEQFPWTDKQGHFVRVCDVANKKPLFDKRVKPWLASLLSSCCPGRLGVALDRGGGKTLGEEP